MQIQFMMFYWLKNFFDKIQNNQIDNYYKLYVQYKSIKNIRFNSLVKINNEVIGKVFHMNKNPDSFILELKIKAQIKIPRSSAFKIKTDSKNIDFIDIELSKNDILLKENEYFSGKG